MKRIRNTGLMCVGLAIALSFVVSGASAQSRSAQTVADFTAVDGAGNSAPGCGGAGGGNGLTTTLNNTFNTPGFDDEGVGVAQRRDIYRLCDIQTQTGANGWTGDALASPEQQFATSTQYAPEEIFASMDDSKASADLQTANISRRLSLVRLSRRMDRDSNETIATRPSASPSALQADSIGGSGRGPAMLDAGERGDRLLLALQEGINAGDEPGGSGLGFFLNGRVHVIEGEQNASERASDGFGGGFTLGADTSLSDELFVGGAVGYTHIDTNYSSSGSESDLDALTFSLYGAFYPTEEIYVDGSISTSYLYLDSRNEVVVFDGGPPVGTLSGDTDGVNFGFDIGTGYALGLEDLGLDALGIDTEPLEALLLEPYFRLSVLYTEIDGFEQRGGDSSLNLGIRTQKSTSVTGSLGVRSEYPLSTRFGILTPYLRIAYVHEFNDENDDVSATPTASGSGGPSFELQAEATDSHYANLGIGVAATLGQGLSQFIDYDGVLGHDNVVIHQVTAGLRLEF